MPALLLLNPIRLGLAALALAGAVLVPPAISATSLGGPGLDPVAGPIEVFADAEVSAGPVGPVIDFTVAVVNSGPEPVRVVLIGELAWPDGSKTRLNFGPPQVLDGNGSMLIQGTSPVPQGVGSGPGTFTATGIVGMIGQGSRKEYGGRLIAQDAVPFTLP